MTADWEAWERQMVTQPGVRSGMALMAALDALGPEAFETWMGRRLT